MCDLNLNKMSEKLKERDRMQDLGIEVRIIYLKEIGWDVDLIRLTQDGDQWWGFVSTVNEPSGSIKCWGFLA
jgi:hypothetical protein